MTTLYLCEKPSQGRDIAAVLGVTQRGNGHLRSPDGQTVVTWCVGHLLEMAPPDAYQPEWKAWNLATLPMVPTRWRLAVKPTAAKQYAAVETLLKQATTVVIATDADREGESIAREVLARCDFAGELKRLWLSALDTASIEKALEGMRPGAATAPLYLAALGRARADWLLGMNLTRTYTLRAQAHGGDTLLSVGRVQTPTLRLVVMRDHAIATFRPIPFFDVAVMFETDAGLEVATKWQVPEADADDDGRCLERSTADAVVTAVAGQAGQVSAVEATVKRVHAPLPFDLSSLQQDASRRFGMTAQGVLNAAQSLYEKHKATTYPRTDCAYLPQGQQAEAPKVLAAMQATDPTLTPLIEKADATLKSRAWNDKKITAHHAIIPTAATVDIATMSDEEAALYDAIRRRYLAQFFGPYVYDDVVAQFVVGDHLFKATGRTTQDAGWRAVLNEDTKERRLPPLESGEPVEVMSAQVEAKKTQPPAPYTDGTLIAAMKSVAKSVDDPVLKARLKETAGIGTEATRPAIIETLLKRGYVARKKKTVVSTDAGRDLIAAVPDAVSDPATTARWEEALDAIAAGTGALDEFMREQLTWLEAIIDSAKQDADVALCDAPVCPECETGALRIRRSKRGPFWGCTRYPECDYTAPDINGEPGTPQAAPKATGIDCPTCGKAMVERRGKKGPFLGCSGYPACKTTRESAADALCR